VIAKSALAEAIQQNWAKYQPSSLNKNGDFTWKEFSYDFKRDLNRNTYYIPGKKKGSSDFVFETSDWGRIVVAKNLKTAKWAVNVASLQDDNRVEPGSEKIKVQDSGDSFSPEEKPENELPQAPVPAPHLAERSKKVVAPQLRKSLRNKTPSFGD
jgi:hypothetical protein